MLSQLSVLAHQIGERTFHLMCDPNSPIVEIKEALTQFIKFVGNIEDQQKHAQAQAQAEADAKAQAEASAIASEVLPVTDVAKPE